MKNSIRFLAEVTSVGEYDVKDWGVHGRTGSYEETTGKETPNQTDH